MALSETEIFSRIDEIELANPPAEVEAGVYALMHEYATGPDRLHRLIERYAASPSLNVVARLIWCIFDWQEHSEDKSILRLVEAFLRRWKPSESHLESASSVLGIVDNEFRKGPIHNILQPELFQDLLLYGLRVRPPRRNWDTVNLDAITALYTMSYEPELRSKVFPEKPTALITELAETIRFLEARSSLAYASWIEEGRLALLRISK